MFPRKIYTQIKQFLGTRDIIVIHESRQVGKTSLLKIIENELPRDDCFYFDLEDSRFLEICEEGVDRVISHLKQRNILKGQKRFYLLIDEIQYLSNPSSLLKIVHDHHPVLKLIVSGSSSFNIKTKFKDSLAGRTVDFELYPLDFEEFLAFHEKKSTSAARSTSRCWCGS